jgi:segregation and condensation protein A
MTVLAAQPLSSTTIGSGDAATSQAIPPVPGASAPSAPDSQDLALARLYGEPLFTLPVDLYIPPDALEVFLDAFEGPLDLLLYLIRKQNFNILDIPMVSVTRQYLGYIEELRRHNLELAAEYLLMAAMLIEIKSRMLLPPRNPASEQEPEDPRAELVRRLQEYEQIKSAAAQLKTLPQVGHEFSTAHAQVDVTHRVRWPSVTPDDLQQAWLAMLRRAQLVQHHKISREGLSVREHMSLVLRKLQGQRFLPFESLFDPAGGIPTLVVTLVALLELGKELLIEITQAEAYAPIYVRLSGTTAPPRH